MKRDTRNRKGVPEIGKGYLGWERDTWDREGIPGIGKTSSPWECSQARAS